MPRAEGAGAEETIANALKYGLDQGEGSLVLAPDHDRKCPRLSSDDPA